uniref:Carn_acyltransf domain-containing protein n=1 Tax=Macrostomum lignano TaxID=282301 RepID=A0A1I8F9B9_9PLAT
RSYLSHSVSLTATESAQAQAASGASPAPPQKGQPLCMEQYYRLFSLLSPSGSRQRRTGAEFGPRSVDPEYVIVACNDQFYVLDAMFGCNDLLTEEAIYGQLRRIVKTPRGECAAESANRPPPRLGVLTSMQRDLWARAREHLA